MQCLFVDRHLSEEAGTSKVYVTHPQIDCFLELSMTVYEKETYGKLPPARKDRFVKIYGLKNCDTCRKALKMLQAAGHDVVLQDVRADPLSAEKLQSFSEAFGDALLNTRSTTWRGLSEEERAGDPIKLLEAHPALMKRPVIETDTLHLGWTKPVQEAFL